MKSKTKEWFYGKGEKALNQPAWVIPMMAIITLIPFLIWIGIVISGIANGQAIIAVIGDVSSAIFVFLGLTFGLLTLLLYERRNYFQIIQSKERKIRELEGKTNSIDGISE